MNPTRYFPAICLASLVLTTLRLPAAESTPPPVVLEHTQRREITSVHARRTYQLSINLPPDYETSGRSYPVLYVLDSNWNFALLHGLQDGLFYGKRLPALIVVGIDYGASYGETMKLREHDFTPTAWSERPGSGGAAAYLAFLEKELVPFIEKTYRADPADRALLGHSYGGLFGVYAWLERPALFRRIVAASPSIYWDGDVLRKRAQERLATETLPARLDLSMGSEEDAGSIAAVQRLAALLEASPRQKGQWQFNVYPGWEHTSVKPVSLTNGLVWIYRP